MSRFQPCCIQRKPEGTATPQIESGASVSHYRPSASRGCGYGIEWVANTLHSARVNAKASRDKRRRKLALSRRCRFRRQYQLSPQGRRPRYSTQSAAHHLHHRDQLLRMYYVLALAAEPIRQNDLQTEHD
jgi:hypothetical protein